MDKEILKRNIEQVIMQPCKDDYPKRIVENGIGIDPLTKSRYIYFKCVPEDIIRYFNVTEDLSERIYDSLPDKYRDHLVTIRHDGEYNATGYVPVFDTDTQAVWDRALDDYIADKAAWCAKYGCD